MKVFLGPTKYCDSADPSIVATMEATRQGYSGREAAVRLFCLVRDEVHYAFGPWGTTASSTLARLQGGCSSKSNLLVALLRAAGIPAAYGVMRVDGQEYFGNLNPLFFKHLMSSFSVHVYAAAWLDGRWVKCDPSTDQEIAEKTSHFCRQTQLVEWDGTRDSLDLLDPRHVHGDLGLLPSIDELLEKPARNATAATCAVLNAYVRFIRSRPPFPSAESLIQAYVEHLGWVPDGGCRELPRRAAPEGARSGATTPAEARSDPAPGVAWRRSGGFTWLPTTPTPPARGRSATVPA